MSLRCNTCGLDAGGLDLKLHLRAPYHSIFCPVCGDTLVERLEPHASFYDEHAQAYVVWDLSPTRPAMAQVAQSFDQLEVTVEGKAVNPYDICFRQVVVFEHAGETVLPYTGVRPEFLHYLNPSAPIAPGTWASSKFTFQVALRNGPVVPIRLPGIFSQTSPGTELNKYKNGTVLNIWPNFRRDGWRDYFVYFVSTDPNIKARSLRVVGERPDEEKTFVDAVPRGEINFVPAYVEIIVADVRGAEYFACYKVELDERKTANVPTGGERPILALDFGTSNTCFAVMLPGGGGVRVIDFRDRTKRLIKGLDVSDATSFTWFPEVGEGLTQNQLPSELSFPQEISKLGPELKDFQPVVNYTIPPFTRYRAGEENYVLGEFKWERAFSKPHLSHLWPLTFDLQYLYLSLAVRMALAEVAADPSCQQFEAIAFVATCPLAFSPAQRDEFNDVIARVQSDVGQRVGVSLDLMKTYDESHAGAAGSGQIPGTIETIYVDVGGGTTDLGFFRFDVEGQEQAVFLDSMQYAGDDVWKAITDGNLSGWAQIKLEREARFRTVRSIFAGQDLSPFRNQAKNRHRATRCAEKFLDGLVEFITRMIAARERARTDEEPLPENLGLYLLGNGWRFVEVIGDAAAASNDVGAAIAERVKEMIEERFRKYNLTCPSLVVQYPILNNLNPKTAVATGAAKLYYNELMFGKVLPEKEFTLRSFLGGNAAITSVGRQVVEWHRPVPHPLQLSHSVGTIHYQIPGGFQFESAQVGNERVEAVDLGPDKGVQTNVNGTHSLGKNLFAYYLERWHTKSLL